MVVGYTDVIDGCTDGSADRIGDPDDKEDALKIALKDDGAIAVQDDKRVVLSDVPTKIVDICSRTTAEKDRVVETVVDVASSSEESTAEYESSDDGDNALDTVGNNQADQMVNKMSDCSEFLVAKNVHITHYYPQQPLDVEQLKYIADANATTKSFWADDAHPDESIERAQKKVSYPFGKALAIGVTVTLLLVVLVVGIELWQLKIPDAEGSTDRGYDNDATIFGPTAPPNITLVTRQSCGLKDPVSYNVANITVYPPPLVIISHTVTSECFTMRDCCERVRNIQAGHLGQGWNDIGTHFLVGGDGRIYEGRQWHAKGAVLYGFNCVSYGVAFIGSFMVETPRHKQVLAAEKLVTQLETNGYLPKNYTIYGAKQLTATESPGATVMEEVKKWAHWSSEVEDSSPCS